MAPIPEIRTCTMFSSSGNDLKRLSIVAVDAFSAYTYQGNRQQHQDIALSQFPVGRFHYHSKAQHKHDTS